jgi:hypothetical protein
MLTVFVLLSLATLVASATTTGFLIDWECWNLPNHVALDGAKLETNPEDHYLHCLKLQRCKAKGYFLSARIANSTTFSNIGSFDAAGNAKVIEWLDAQTGDRQNVVVTVDSDSASSSAEFPTLSNVRSIIAGAGTVATLAVPGATTVAAAACTDAACCTEIDKSPRSCTDCLANAGCEFHANAKNDVIDLGGKCLFKGTAAPVQTKKVDMASQCLATATTTAAGNATAAPTAAGNTTAGAGTTAPATAACADAACCTAIDKSPRSCTDCLANAGCEYHANAKNDVIDLGGKCLFKGTAAAVQTKKVDTASQCLDTCSGYSCSECLDKTGCVFCDTAAAASEAVGAKSSLTSGSCEKSCKVAAAQRKTCNDSGAASLVVSAVAMVASIALAL